MRGLGQPRRSWIADRPKSSPTGWRAVRWGFLGFPGVVPIEGGVPLLAAGTVIGAVG
jgi:uncharacterized protein GlcG (DUF336 family)